MGRGLDSFTVKEAEEYLNGIPKFTRKKHSIEELREILDETGLSLDGVRLIHVAGTNGKGSVCAFLSSILREAGEPAAVFTSPHLVSVRERFVFDGKQVEEEEFLAAFCRIQQLLPMMEERGLGHPSYFEYLFLMFAAMMQKRREYTAVLETGLGGRLDATNCVRRPQVCVITSVSLDHMEYLGTTVEQIAGEKAGIIKPGVPVFYDRSDAQAAAVIESQARRLKSPAFGVGEEASWQQTLEQGHLFLKEGEKTLEIPFAAPYQAVNAMLAVRTAGYLGISWQAVSEGVRKTVWPGRMEEIAPGVYLDGAHNEGGIRAFAGAAAEVAARRREESGKDGRIFLLFAAVSDKNYESMLETLMRKLKPDRLVLTHLYTSRALSMEAMEKAAHRVADGCEVQSIPDVKTAYQTLVQEKRPEDTCFCVGSLYLIGELEKKISRTGFDSTVRMV